jgi:hypothetical protein
MRAPRRFLEGSAEGRLWPIESAPVRAKRIAAADGEVFIYPFV